MAGSQRVSAFGFFHTLIGMTILFGTLHPIRDMLDGPAFELCRGMAIIQTLNGIGLLVLEQRPGLERPALLIAAGVLASAAMAYWIAFTGTHPFDPLVPLGGSVMLAGWAWAGYRSLKA